MATTLAGRCGGGYGAVRHARRPLRDLVRALLLCLVMWSGGLVAQGDDRVVRVGLYENVPKVGTGEDGVVGGVFVHLLESIARREGWTLEYVQCEWAACLHALQDGRIDLMPDVALTETRHEFFGFHSIPVTQAWSQVYAPSGTGLGTFEDLAGQRIAVLGGSVQEEYLERRRTEGPGLDYELVRFPQMDAVLAAVSDGRADVAVTNNFYGRRHARVYGLVETPITFEQVGLYFAGPRRGQEERLAVIDAYLELWKDEAGSPYQVAMQQALAPPEPRRLPGWLLPAFGVVLTLALLFAVMAGLLRWRIRYRTRELGAVNQRLQHLLDSAPVVIYQLRARNLEPVWVSANIERLFGVSHEAALRPGFWSQQLHPEDRLTVLREKERILEQGFGVQEYRLFDGWGKLRYVRDEMRVNTPDVQRGEVEIIGSWTDLTASMNQEEELRQLTHYDGRTGLPNRSLLQDRLGHMLERALADSRARWVLLLDLDRFRHVNETLGTSVGDEVLQGVARRLGQYADLEDTVARIGADEFCLLVEHPPEDDDKEIWLDGLLETIREPFALAGRSLVLTGSVGLGVFPEDGTTRDELLAGAELAMENARAQGGDTWRRYESHMGERTERRLFLETDLRQAIANNEFVLHFQPQFHLVSGACVGVEVLVRWQHPQRGMVSPAEFIPLAEETGLVAAIDRWVLDAACAQLATWDREGQHIPGIAVNISARELHDEQLVSVVGEVLQRHGILAERLELELTETMIMEQPERSLAVLRRLNTLGVRLAMDDFGSGYSNLAHLLRLPLHRLKIDQSLVRDIGHSRHNESIVRAIIALAEALDLELIAEGVEEDSQRDFLLREGCAIGQGFLLGRPVSAEDLMSRLSEH